MIYQILHDSIKAEEDYKKAIQLNGDYYLNYYFLAKLYLKSKMYGKAIRFYTYSIDENSLFAPCYYQRAYSYSQLRKYYLAAIDFQKAIDLVPSYQKNLIVIETYNNLGTQYLKEGLFKKAIYYFNRSIEYDQRWGNSYINRGIAYRFLKMYDESISDFYSALELDSLSADIYFQLGITFEEYAQPENVIKNYKMAIVMDPGYDKAHVNLGKYYFRLEKYKSALNHFDRALEINRGNFWILYWKALAYDKIRDFYHAKKYYKLFIDLAPQTYFKQIRFIKDRIKILKHY